MKKYLLPVVTAILFFAFALPALAQSSDDIDALRKEIEALKKSQKAMQKDIQEIKTQVRARQAQPEFKEAMIELGDNPFKGNKNAKVTIVEFSDYQWPYCAKYVRETMPEIEKEYIATGKVKFVFIDFPLLFHKQALKAAEGAHCAGDQGKYWEMHNEIFANQNALEPKNLSEYAKKIGLDITKFQQCLDSGKYAEQIEKNIHEAREAGASGAPTFFMGYTDPDKKTIKATKKLVGAQPYDKFKEAIESLLSPQK